MEKGIPEEIKSRIIELWQKGHTSGEIAKEVGKTRNAIMGFVHRQKIKGLDLRSLNKRPKKMPVKKPKKILSYAEKRLPPSERKHIQLHELTSTSCRFIVAGEGANSVFCGDKITNRSYCGHHAKICYQPFKQASS